jgi:hypothetical protein
LPLWNFKDSSKIKWTWYFLKLSRKIDQISKFCLTIFHPAKYLTVRSDLITILNDQFILYKNLLRFVLHKLFQSFKFCQNWRKISELIKSHYFMMLNKCLIYHNNKIMIIDEFNWYYVNYVHTFVHIWSSIYKQNCLPTA